MKETLLALTALCGISTASMAQALEVYPSQINFGFVDELSEDSVEITFYNNTPSSFDVEVAHWITPYADSAFEVVPAIIQIPGLDSAKAWLKFHPQQNIDYSGDVIFADEGPGGAVVLEVNGHGRFSKSYYTTTEGLSEQALKNALNVRLASSFISLSYNAARDEMYADLDNVNGDVECVYTGRVATFNDRPGANANSFNCEHTFPQGFFSSAQPMRADIHHLFPTDAGTNSRRSNHPFGIVTNPTWTGGGSKYGNSVFEPRDAHKGAAARAMLYFVIRYQDYTNFFAPQESILRQWHQSFLPTAFEEGRNDGIYLLQNNRNPFVDYPQLERRINSFTTTSVADPVYELSIAHDTLYVPQSASSNHRVTYRTAVLNTGNQLIFVQPQAFADTTIHYENNSNLGANLAPGEAKVIEFSYRYGTSFPAGGGSVSMSLSTNLPSGAVDIPIRSTLFDLSDNEFRKEQQFLYPNPADKYFYLPEGASKAHIYDANGRLIFMDDQTTIPVQGLSSGTYMVQYQLDSMVYKETIVIQH